MSYVVSEIEYDPDGNRLYYDKGDFRNISDAWNFGKKNFQEYEIVDNSVSFGKICFSTNTRTHKMIVFDNMIVLKNNSTGNFVYYSGKESRKQLSAECINGNCTAYQYNYSYSNYDGNHIDIFSKINPDMSISNENIAIKDIQFTEYVSGIEFSGFIPCSISDIQDIRNKLTEIFASYKAELSFNMLDKTISK